jgi:hypothetical protein
MRDLLILLDSGPAHFVCSLEYEACVDCQTDHVQQFVFLGFSPVRAVSLGIVYFLAKTSSFWRCIWAECRQFVNYFVFFVLVVGCEKRVAGFGPLVVIPSPAIVSCTWCNTEERELLATEDGCDRDAGGERSASRQNLKAQSLAL